VARSQQDDLTSVEAAGLLHVSAATVKRWADDGWLPSLRTRGGHRRFRRADVFEAAQRLAVRGERSGSPLAERLAARDTVLRVQAELLAERARSGSWAAVCEACIPVLTDLVARHRAAAAPYLALKITQGLLEAALARCADELPLQPSAPTAVVAAAEDEALTVELSLLRLCVRECGWTAHCVGAVPTGDLAALASGGGIDAVVLFASVARARAGLEAIVGQIGPACARAGVPLALAGRAAWPPDAAPSARIIRAPTEVAGWIRELDDAAARRRGRTRPAERSAP
jgi:excisionase family DNA binding protein